jgi:hypothetical protein
VLLNFVRDVAWFFRQKLEHRLLWAPLSGRVGKVFEKVPSPKFEKRFVHRWLPFVPL